MRRVDTIDQYVESNTLLDNDDKIIVDKPIATEEILNDEEIIATIQAEKNEKGSTEQKIEDEDELPEPL
ncbi:2848_t:CDS:2 [Dentiscutata erythropus]|uniref:2848_t:CDS:1 n=1 Tax=Dentiscutata erythropus TaxID=1348616 RepID=A0A9N9JLU0_9GLOM|nr:2848_t:CDS:2 [Dentiscutata erythropus]